MKKRNFSVLALPLLMLVFAAVSPLSASAVHASAVRATAPQQRVHFFSHSGTTQGHAISSKVQKIVNGKLVDASDPITYPGTPGVLGSNNLIYGSGPVMGGTTNVYAIYWEPNNNVSPTYHGLIERYFGDVGASGLYHNNVQYPDADGNIATDSNFVASWTDTTPYPESPVLDTDIQDEVSRAQSANGWSSSINNIFFVFTEANQDLCFDSSQSQCASNTFCAYHSFFGSNTIYAAMPYAASFRCNGGAGPNNDQAADETINVTSHEQMEAATDPLLGAWVDSRGAEIGDKCAWNFGNANGTNIVMNGNPYRLQKEWDNARRGCVITGP